MSAARTSQVNAGQVRVDSAAFSGNLSAADNTVQKALGTLDALTASGAGVIQQPITHASHPSVLVGTIPAGRTIEKTVLDITSGFDVGVQMTVGHAGAPALLMLAVDSLPSQANMYRVESGYLCLVDMEVRLFFGGPVPTTGTGRVLVYFS